MQLEIQKYLRSGKSVQDLIWEFDLQVFTSEKYPDLVCFDYSLISPKTEKIVRESRGLILDKNNWDVVCMSMEAFEYTNDSLIFKDAYAIEKYDGCLVVLYNYNDEWITGTRFSVDGDCYVASAYSPEKKIKWNQLFYNTINELINLDLFLSSLDKNKCYSFELCSKENKNVVIYDSNFVKLLSICNKETLEEENIFEDYKINQNFKILLPKYFNIQEEKDIEIFLREDRPGYDFEGLVILDQNFKRQKVRNKNFDALTSNISTSEEAKISDYISNLLKSISPAPESLYYCYTYPLNPSLGILCNSDTTPLPSGAYLISFNNPDCTTCTNTTLYSWCRDNGDGTQDCVGGSQFAPYDPSYLNGSFTIDQYAGPFTSLNCDGTCITYTPPGGGGGTSGLSIMSAETKGCASNWSPKKQSNDEPITASIIGLSQWFRSEFMKYKSGNSDSMSVLVTVWESAFKLMNEGKGITYILVNSSLEEQMSAIQKYNDMKRKNLL